MTKKTKNQIDDSPFAGGVLYEKAKSGEEWFKYSYPQHGLPKTSVPSAPMCSPLVKYCEQQIKSAPATDNTLPKENKEVDYDPNNPFAGGVLYEKAKSGEEWFKYSYPQHGLPKTSVPSAPVCSPLAIYVQQQRKSGNK